MSFPTPSFPLIASMAPTDNSTFGLNCTLPAPSPVSGGNPGNAGAYSNSYVDIPYANNYWANHYNQTAAAVWSGLQPQQQAFALIAACRVLETIRFTVVTRLRDDYPMLFDRRSGTFVQLNDQLLPIKFYYYQRLQFPRNLDRDIIDGTLYIPEPICMAQCEQAVYLIGLDTSSMQSRMQGVVQDVTYVGNIHLRQNYVQGGTTLSPVAREMCRPYMLTTSHEIRRQ